jgi:hypothetical protein
MQKLHFFPTGIDMISIEVQTSQPYTARYILAAGLSSVYFFLASLLRSICILERVETVLLLFMTNIIYTGRLHEYQVSSFISKYSLKKNTTILFLIKQLTRPSPQSSHSFSNPNSLTYSAKPPENPHIFPEPLLRALIKVTTARTFHPPPSKLTGYSCDGSKQSMRMRCWHASATARFGCIAETPPPAAPPRGEPKPCRAASRGLAMR